MKNKYVTEEMCNFKFNDLKKDVEDIKVSLNDLKSNHLVHIYEAITINSTKLRVLGYVGGALLSGMVTLIISMLLLIIGGK